GASDIAIVEFRKLMVNAARVMAETGQALGAGDNRKQPQEIASFEGVIEKIVDWRQLERKPRKAQPA
ncbi:MAG: MarR family transcriptional regulator, partial [Burkholderiaceae bacterium]